MKVSFIVPARDKEKYVGPCVRSVLMQTYPGIEIVLSDQGSVDGTRAVMADLISGYKGSHKVRLVDCPDTEPKGYAGMNAHLRWLHNQCEGDIVLMTSADDIAHPERTERVVAAFREFNPSFVATQQVFCDPDGSNESQTAWPSDTSWVDARTHLFKLTGSSSSTAWARDLVDKYDPFELATVNDVTVPYYATLERGLYFLAEPLHIYLRHADANNTGLEGAIRAADAAEDVPKKLALLENAAFQLCHTYMSMLKRVQHLWPDRAGDEITALHERYFETAMQWTVAREDLTRRRISPIALRS